jgi:hypothetical protein
MAAVALIALASVPALAQERFSGLTGTVKDASGAVLPGATVTITNKETAKVYTAVSGGDGVYRVLDLEPGRYSVKFELAGFQAGETPGRRGLLGKTLTIDSAESGRPDGGGERQRSLRHRHKEHHHRAQRVTSEVRAHSKAAASRTWPGLAVGEHGRHRGGIQVNAPAAEGRLRWTE